MALAKDTLESFILTDGDDVKKSKETNAASVLSSGDTVNNMVLKTGGSENVDCEPCERKKKTRRGKPKRKNPYNKEGNDSRQTANRPKNRPRFAQRQAHPDAPNNTNQFLMEDHNTYDVELNPATSIGQLGMIRPPRLRDPSFTSADSDEDFFYSSPEDEEEFLTKEFSNTYEDLHVETLQGMSKSELIQQVLQLEEKIDMLEKRLGSKSKNDTGTKDLAEKYKAITEKTEESVPDQCPTDKIKQYQQEIAKLALEKEKLQIENDRLRRRNRSSSVSSVDSESDSTTSSPSSVSDLSDKEELMCSSEENKNNEDIEDSRATGRPSVNSDESNDIAMGENDDKT